MATIVYIDGFNLYYGALRGTPYKWLDLEALSQRLLPKDDVHLVRYFTARITARPDDPQQAQRQETYRAVPESAVYQGFREFGLPASSCSYRPLTTRPLEDPLEESRYIVS